MTDPAPAEPSATASRLQSLDALRGFDMFWIVGGEDIVHALAELTGWGIALWASSQLHHVAWDGFVFYDMIFPLFLFIAGVAMPFSLTRRLERGDDKGRLTRHVVRRGLVLVVLGVIYNNGLFRVPFEQMRFPSVLGRIGLAYMFAALIVLNTRLRGQIVWFWGLLLGYWAAMSWIPVPGHGAGQLTVEGSLAAYLDRLLIPGRLHLEVHDPEGLLSTVPAIGTALLGVFAGTWLRASRRLAPGAPDDAAASAREPAPGRAPGDGLVAETADGGWWAGRPERERKAAGLAAAGLACLAAGWLWGLAFPINKNLWTSSFVLYAGGWSLLLLALFYLVIDAWGYARWAFFFVIIGMNSILIYMAGRFIDFAYTTDALFGGLLRPLAGRGGEVLFWIGFVAVEWGFLYFLYRKRVFLRV